MSFNGSDVWGVVNKEETPEEKARREEELRIYKERTELIDLDMDTEFYEIIRNLLERDLLLNGIAKFHNNNRFVTIFRKYHHKVNDDSEYCFILDKQEIAIIKYCRSFIHLKGIKYLMKDTPFKEVICDLQSQK